MTLGSFAFAVLVWGSLASVVAVFSYLLWIVVHEAGAAGDSTESSPEGEP